MDTGLLQHEGSCLGFKKVADMICQNLRQLTLPEVVENPPLVMNDQEDMQSDPIAAGPSSLPAFDDPSDSTLAMRIN